MDSYIERPELWPDFHLSLVVAISAELQPQLKPKRVALIGRRRSTSGTGDDGSWRFVTVAEPSEPYRPVTGIDLMDPITKSPGEGRDEYLLHRGNHLKAGAHLVEIDLLRAGVPALAVASAFRECGVAQYDYLAVATRAFARQHEVYPVTIRQSLPTVPVPVSQRTADDVKLDLQCGFGQCWEGGPYPELLHYEGLPPGPMSAQDVAWCEHLLRQKGLR